MSLAQVESRSRCMGGGRTVFLTRPVWSHSTVARLPHPTMHRSSNQKCRQRRQLNGTGFGFSIRFEPSLLAEVRMMLFQP